MTAETDFGLIHRYLLAEELCRGLNVLDLTVPDAPGAAVLANTARTIVKAWRPSSASNAREILCAPDASIDAVISLSRKCRVVTDTAVISEIRRVLRPQGFLILTCEEQYGTAIGSVLQDMFPNIRFLSQALAPVSAILSLKGEASPCLIFNARPDAPPRPAASHADSEALVIVASAQHLPIIPNSLYLRSGLISPQRAMVERDAALADAEMSRIQRDVARVALRRSIALSEARLREVASWKSRTDELHVYAKGLEASRTEIEQALAAYKSLAAELESRVAEFGRLVTASHQQLTSAQAEIAVMRRRKSLRGMVRSVLVIVWRLIPISIRRRLRRTGG